MDTSRCDQRHSQGRDRGQHKLERDLLEEGHWVAKLIQGAPPAQARSHPASLPSQSLAQYSVLTIILPSQSLPQYSVLTIILLSQSLPQYSVLTIILPSQSPPRYSVLTIILPSQSPPRYSVLTIILPSQSSPQYSVLTIICAIICSPSLCLPFPLPWKCHAGKDDVSLIVPGILLNQPLSECMNG